MKLSTLKTHLATLDTLHFRLPDGSPVPAHFHVTEVGRVTKHFIDCGGTERTETTVSLQLWEGADTDHQLAPQRFRHILDLSQKILGDEDLEVEVEYQQATLGKFGLEPDGTGFLLTTKHTACLASDACGVSAPAIIAKPKISLAVLGTTAVDEACCTPGGGCC